MTTDIFAPLTDLELFAPLTDLELFYLYGKLSGAIASTASEYSHMNLDDGMNQALYGLTRQSYLDTVSELGRVQGALLATLDTRTILKLAP